MSNYHHLLYDSFSYSNKKYLLLTGKDTTLPQSLDGPCTQVSIALINILSHKRTYITPATSVESNQPHYPSLGAITFQAE